MERVPFPTIVASAYRRSAGARGRCAAPMVCGAVLIGLTLLAGCGRGGGTGAAPAVGAPPPAAAPPVTVSPPPAPPPSSGPPPPLLAGIYYISPSGDDAAAGTSPATAWRTVGRVNAVAFAGGASILFQGGQLFAGTLRFDRNDRGSSAAPITVGSYGAGRAALAAGANSGVEVIDTGGLRIADLNLRGNGAAQNRGSGILLENHSDRNLKFEGVHIERVDLAGFGQYGVAITADHGSSGFRDVRVTDSVVHDNGLDGIASWGDFPLASGYPHEDFYIGSNTVYRNTGTPNQEINTGSGIVLGGVSNAVIEYNEVFENGTGNDFCGGPVGVWAWDAHAVTIQFNESHHNHSGTIACDGGGFDLDGGVTDSVVQYNYAHDNDGPGYLVAQFDEARPLARNVIRFNISQNDGRNSGVGAGLVLWADETNPYGAREVEVYHNTFFATPPATGPIPAIASVSGVQLQKISIRNNIIQTAGAPLVAVPPGAGVTFQGNVYWVSGFPFAIGWYGTTFGSLAEWRAETGQETLPGGVAVGLAVEPQLNAPGAGPTIGDPSQLATLEAYRLQPASPVLGAALDLAAVFGLDVGARDFFGAALPPAGGYSIGAQQPPRD